MRLISGGKSNLTFTLPCTPLTLKPSGSGTTANQTASWLVRSGAGPVSGRSKSHEVPDITELARRLAAAVPAQQQATIVHGDFRADN